MQRSLGRGRHVSVQRLAQEGVREAVSAQRAGDLPHQAQRQRRRQTFENRLGRTPCHRGEQLEIELAPQDGRDLQQSERRWRERREALAEELACPWRDPGHALVWSAAVGAGREQVRHFDHEKRISSREAEHLVHQALRERLPPQPLAHEVLHRRTSEACKRHVASKTENAREQSLSAGALGGLRCAQRRKDEEGRRSKLARHEVEERERADVGPMEIIEHDEQGLRSRRVRECTGDPVEQLQSGMLGRRVRVRDRLPCTQDGEQGLDVG